MATIPVGVQMYTLRDETEKDFVGTLRKVSEIGYAGVEFAGYGGLAAGELKSIIDDLNLRSIGAHTGTDALEADMAGVIDFQLTLGSKFVIVPWIQPPTDFAGWQEFAGCMNRYGQELKRHGLQLCFHNHAGEFVRIGGMYGLDLLYENTDAELVQAELDLYWVKKGGEDPARYMQKYAGRVPLLHIKDMAADAEGTFTEFGTGIIDWDAIFAVAPAVGAQWYIVEQDVCQRPCLESVAISFNNLKARGMA